MARPALVACASIALALATGVCTEVPPPIAAAAAVNPLANPTANRSLPALASTTGMCGYGANGHLSCPSPCYPEGKIVYNSSPGCTRLLLEAINKAQAAEHRAPFVLPSNYEKLSPTAQLFVLVNFERISHGVPPLVGLSPYLNAAASAAAREAEDPVVQPSYGPVTVGQSPEGLLAIGGAWAGNSVNAASAVFGWFYDDGWGGKGNTLNFACTSPTASGCWGHRDQLLGLWAGTTCTDCVAGAGYASPAARNWQESYDFLVVRPTSFPTPLTFTWNGDVVPHLPKGWERDKAA